MENFFTANIIANIELLDDDFNFLCEACRRHYDGKVNSLVEVGGRLYGLKNRREWSKSEDKTMDLDFRQIDLLTKALEMSLSEETGMRLSIFFRQLLHAMNEKGTEANKFLKQPRQLPTTSEGIIIAHESFAFAIRNIKTLDGDPSNYVVIVKGEAAIIQKRILSKGLIKSMKMIRLTKWGKLYEQIMPIRLNTLAQISFEVFEQLRNQVQQK